MIKNKSRSIALMVIGLLWTGFAKAQESTNASGGEAIGSAGTVSYSIGQVVYTTQTGSQGSTAQGVQHAYEIFNVGNNENELNVTIITFPNPASDNIILQISDYNIEQLWYQLFDIQGKQLRNEQITTQKTQINMSSLPTATYLIKVINQGNKKVQSFKIIKN